MILRIVQVAWSCILNMLMGGVVYGYASLVYLLMSSEDEGGCSLKSKYAQSCFTVAISFSCISPLFSSAILEGYGPRFTIISSTLLFSTGCLIFGVSDIHRLGLFIPGLSLMAFAGPGIHGSTHYCLHLFPRHKGLVSTLLEISFHLSFIVFYVAQAMWIKKLDNTGDSDFRSIFCGYSFMCLATVLPTLFLVPDSMSSDNRNFMAGSGFSALSSANPSSASLNPQKEMADYGAIGAGSPRDGRTSEESHTQFDASYSSLSGLPLVSQVPLNDTSEHSAAGTATSGINGPISVVAGDEVEAYDRYHHMTLRAKLQSLPFQRIALLFGLGTLWVNFYIGTVDVSLGDSAILPWKVHHTYAVRFSVVLAAGAVAIPVVSACLHRTKGLMHIPLTSLVLSVLSLLWGCGVLVESPHTILPSFVCYSFFRVFLYAFSFAYVHDVFGAKYSDVMIGILFLCSGVVNLLSIPLMNYAMGDCATAAESMLTTCDRGRWAQIFLLKIASSGYFFFFTLQEWKERRGFLFDLGYIEFSGRGVGAPSSKYAGRIQTTKSNDSMRVRASTFNKIPKAG